MLKRITPDELKEYLRKHKLWVWVYEFEKTEGGGVSGENKTK